MHFLSPCSISTASLLFLDKKYTVSIRTISTTSSRQVIPAVFPSMFFFLSSASWAGADLLPVFQDTSKDHKNVS